MGRPKGSRNRKTQIFQEIKTRVVDFGGTGEGPIEFLTRIMQGQRIEVEKNVYWVPDVPIRVKAAIELAPYIYPRLASIEQKLDATVTAQVKREPLTDVEFEALIADATPEIVPTNEH